MLFSDELFLISLKCPENGPSKYRGRKGLILSLEVQVHEGWWVTDNGTVGHGLLPVRSPVEP